MTGYQTTDYHASPELHVCANNYLRIVTSRQYKDPDLATFLAVDQLIEVDPTFVQ
jgi:hypothetical protein